MLIHQFKYFKLFVLFFTVIFISTSCQTPNITNKSKIESKLDNKNKDLKIGSFKVKKTIHYDDYSGRTLISFKYNQTDTYKQYIAHRYKTGLTDPNFYLVSETTSTIEKENAIAITYVNAQWRIEIFSQTFYLPLSGGSFKYETKPESLYKEIYTVTLTVTQNELIFTINGEGNYDYTDSSGPYYCLGDPYWDLSIHEPYCYYLYQRIIKDTIINDGVVKLPLRTSSLNLSVTNHEINDTISSSEIKINPTENSGDWKLELYRETGDENCPPYNIIVGGNGSATIPFTEKINGTYKIKAYFTKYPNDIEEDSINVNTKFDLNINPTNLTVSKDSNLVNIDIISKDRPWNLKVSLDSIGSTYPMPSPAPTI